MAERITARQKIRTMALVDDGGPVPALKAAVDVALTVGRPMFMSSVDHFISDLPAASEQREDLITVRDGTWQRPQKGE